MPHKSEKKDSAVAGQEGISTSLDSLSSPRMAGISAWELAFLAVIIGTAVFLRFGRWDLIEFKNDEANALQLALEFAHKGSLPLVGLMSSVHVKNPPLFIYLLIPIVALSTNLALITSFIASTGTAAVVVCWHIGRKYYSATVGLMAAALFAVSPWAVFFSRKIWAQDLVPIFAALSLWALHALILGRNRRAIFWVVLLPLCVIQIHFSGLALTAAVGCILLLLRPKFDWRFAAGGVVVAFVVFVPYLYYQVNNGWADFIQATKTVGGNPFGGSSRSNYHYLTHTLGIVNGGEIEDLLGLSKPKFEENLIFENWALKFQQFTFVAAVLYLLVLVIRGIRWSKMFPWVAVDSYLAKTSWILVCWVLVPLMVYSGLRLSTLLSYYVVFYPAPYLLCAVIWHKLWIEAGTVISAKVLLCGVLGIMMAGNLSFILNFYGFITRNDGAYIYGTPLIYKQQAVAYLAGNSDVVQLQAEKRLVEMDQFGRVTELNTEFPLLAILAKKVPAGAGLPTDTAVVLVDCNRAKFTDEQWAHLATLPKQEFGPIQFYFLPRSQVKMDVPLF